MRRAVLVHRSGSKLELTIDYVALDDPGFVLTDRSLSRQHLVGRSELDAGNSPVIIAGRSTCLDTELPASSSQAVH